MATTAWHSYTVLRRWLTHANLTAGYSLVLLRKELHRNHDNEIPKICRLYQGTYCRKLWFNSCQKSMQGSFILNPLLEEDQTHKPVKWLALKPNTMSAGHVQDHVCTAKKKWRATKLQCSKCKVGLCAVPCFTIYCKKVNFWIRLPSQHGKEAISRNVSAVHFIITITFHFREL